MKKAFLCLAIIMISLSSFAQDELDKIIEEGIVLHDRGDYAGAIKKYDEVLAKDPGNFSANYEKGYALLILKRYDECIAINKMLSEKYPDHSEMKNVWINWGSALDDQGDHEGALKIYDKGLVAFPEFYLLYYNKAITYARANDRDQSMKAAEDALLRKPLHPSSHNLLGLLMKGQNNIASALASVAFLSIEASGKRAQGNMESLDLIFGGNVKKTGKNEVTININSAMLDTTGKGDDNFTSVELVITFAAALDSDKKYKKETKPERLERKLKEMITMMDEIKEGRTGFFWKFYVPFVIKMKSRNYLETFSHIAYSSAGDSDNDKWLEKNADKVNDFYGWVEKYDWD
ncbi:MAG: tetratricopeptide repeat protein [Bacteroidetes bacterium]|jgi:tetratricopeptide (TPR) repeat protein|nr:MAG: tetratricopeptide repeat protein [Bacteroidota bacterium]